jgi:hypothetical protein
MTRPRVKSLRRVGRVAAIVGINLAVIAVLLEVTLRAFPALIPAGVLRYFNPQLRAQIGSARGLLNTQDIITLPRDDGGVPHRLWLFAPGSRHHQNTMDQEGFCNPAGASAGNLDTVDVVVLGDSFAYCWGVPPESTWVGLAERSGGASVYNLGVPDMGPYEYVQFLKQFGLRKHPRLVVMALYEGNDLRDAVRHHAYRAATHDPAAATDRPAAGKLSLPRRAYFGLRDGWVGRHCYTLNLLLTAVGLAYQTRVEGPAVSQNNFRYQLDFGSRVIPMNAANADPDEVAYARQLRKGEVAVDVFDDALQEFVRLSREHRFVPVVLFLPSAHSVYAQNVRYQDTTLANLMPWVHDQHVSFLTRQGDALGYRFSDLTGALRAAAGRLGPDRLLYAPDDLHFTRAGHTEAAAAIRDVLAPPPVSTRRP